MNLDYATLDLLSMNHLVGYLKDWVGNDPRFSMLKTWLVNSEAIFSVFSKTTAGSVNIFL